jgi:hypothetical protein
MHHNEREVIMKALKFMLVLALALLSFNQYAIAAEISKGEELERQMWADDDFLNVNEKT